jgi:hypothetical protein
MKANLGKNPFKAEHHHFLLHTVSKPTKCQMCERPLLGIIHQGMQCQKCGIITHRKCACTGLPHCQASASIANRSRHHIFGVSLIDLVVSGNQSATSTENLQVPWLLVKLLRHIESRALATNEDLYDVYRLSSDTARLDQVRQLINESGVELVNLDQFDLNTIASLVKSFLRDLQNSVIPEELYSRIVGKIQTMSTEELCSLINTNIDPVHMACLRFVMQHLIRVWSYQFKVKGCHYLPDKLFHIFRSILMRPQWSRIVDIVHNVDNQSLAMQRLMLEYNWGVELPEYKIRPKRPMNPSPDTSSLLEKDGTRDRSPAVVTVSRSEPMSGVSSNSSLMRPRKNSYNRENLIECQWYWGAIDRDETMLILKNCPDGSFVVRDSSERNTSINSSSPYTLCVMKGNHCFV